MVAIEKSGTIQTFNRLPNEWNDEKGYHINFRKVTNKETIKPRVIIHPKSIIGLMPLKINDRNAQTVVKTV